MQISHYLRANSHSCGYDAITFVGSKNSFEDALIVWYHFGLLRFFLTKIEEGGGCTNFLSQLVNFFSFDYF